MQWKEMWVRPCAHGFINMNTINSLCLISLIIFKGLAFYCVFFRHIFNVIFLLSGVTPLIWLIFRLLLYFYRIILLPSGGSILIWITLLSSYWLLSGLVSCFCYTIYLSYRFVLLIHHNDPKHVILLLKDYRRKFTSLCSLFTSFFHFFVAKRTKRNENKTWKEHTRKKWFSFSVHSLFLI